MSNSGKPPLSQKSKSLIAAGDVIRVRLHAAHKPKILICICPVTHRYMVINTDPYEAAPTAQLRVTPKQLFCLEHTSHIDTSKLVRLSQMETVGVVETTPTAHRGQISMELKRAIMAKIIEHGIMPQDQIDLLFGNFFPDEPLPQREKPKGRVLK